MTSMIDVVFLLLIFFLVTTTFVQSERQLSSNIKIKEKGAAEARDLEPAIVELLMKDGRVQYRLGAVQTPDLAKIADLLKEFDGKENGAFVKVDDEVPFGYSAKVIGLCRAANFPTVSYLPRR